MYDLKGMMRGWGIARKPSLNGERSPKFLRMFLRGVDHLNDDDFFIWMPTLIAFILTLHIIIVYGITPDAIFYAIITVSLAICSYMFWVFIKPWVEKKRRKLKQHLESLVNVLKMLNDIFINDKTITISPERDGAPKLIDIQNSKDFKLLFQHLESYTDIPNKYWKIVESVKNANKKLNELEEHISDRVNIRDGHKKNYFLLSLNELTKRLLEQSAEEIYSNKLQVKEKGTSAFFHAYYDEIYIYRFEKRSFNKDEINECLSSLLKDKVFQTMLKDATKRRKDLYKNYNEFSKEVKDIIDDIERHGAELEGKCDECSSFWKLR